MVVAASYAPLFVNDHDHKWDPNAIVFNSAQSYGSPSYYNQLIWANSFSGTVSGSVHTLNYTTNVDKTFAIAIATGILAKSPNTMVYIHKLVNTAARAQTITIDLMHIPSTSKLSPTVDIITLGGSADGKNSFAAPMMVAPKTSTMTITSPTFSVTVAPYSVYILRAYVMASQDININIREKAADME